MTVTLADPWLAQNAGRRYPLADDSSGITDNVLLDFRCTARGIPVGRYPKAVLTSVENVTGHKRLNVSVYASGSSADTLVGTLAFDFPANMAASAPFTASAGTAALSGYLTASSAVLGVAEAQVLAIPFAASTTVADALKVDSLQALESLGDVDDTTNGISATTTAVSGRIVLTDGRNTEPYLDGNRLRLDIYKGAGLGERCQSAASGQTCSNVLFTINGERPGSGGNIRITGKDGVSITARPSEHAVEIRIGDAAADRLASTCERVC